MESKNRWGTLYNVRPDAFSGTVPHRRSAMVGKTVSCSQLPSFPCSPQMIRPLGVKEHYPLNGNRRVTERGHSISGARLVATTDSVSDIRRSPGDRIPQWCHWTVRKRKWGTVEAETAAYGAVWLPHKRPVLLPPPCGWCRGDDERVDAGFRVGLIGQFLFTHG